MDLPRTSPESVGLDSSRLRKLIAWQQRMVDDEITPFSQVVIGRKGKVAHFSTVGFSDLQAKTPAKENNLMRFYSMTKPITCAALLTFYEEGRFLLNDPLHLYLGPKWKKQNMTVYVSGDAASYKTEPCTSAVTVKDIMMHTAGLSYGFDEKGLTNKVDAIYTSKLKGHRSWTLADFCDRLAELPLMFQPGSKWFYSFSIDVCGRLCEVLGGKPLDEVLRDRVLEPLRMKDTFFEVPQAERHRMAKIYMPKGGVTQLGAVSDPSSFQKGLTDITQMLNPGGSQALLMGGGGLYSTVSDYARFACAMHSGGVLDGRRVLSRKTVEFMTVNHLKDHADMETMAYGGYTELARAGVGFGLGVSSIIDPAKTGQLSSPGTWSWGGAASTFFWCDPAEDLFVVFATQLMFRNDMVTPMRNWLNQLVYACLCNEPDASRAKTLPVAAQSKL